MLLANRYDDRTHFIFELLQNAEDALAKRGGWDGQRAVEFSLSADALSVTHFGKPFDENDVRGICGIGESTKDLTAIGRFGIGFKSVYAFTDSPEIHSGTEHFAIDSFVWPRAISGSYLPQEQTIIRLPFRSDDSTAVTQILAGLQRLGPRTLLFLREIDEVSWSIDGGSSGMYLRDKPKTLGNGVRRVMVIGEDKTTNGVEEEHWLIFSRSVSNDGHDVGHIELAFALEENTGGGDLSVKGVTDSPLVVFFPTVLSTNLGFLVQGPYRTTPSRDNVPEGDPWNQHLVNETSVLLVDALQELRRLDLLSVSALRSLPLDASRFRQGSRFAPLFSAVRETLRKDPLLPLHSIGYAPAEKAKIARTQDLRDLIGPKQLADLFQSDQELVWLSEDITIDRTPDLRTYLMNELDVHEVTPEWLVPRLTGEFLGAQPDEWIERLYGFLNGQGALLQRLRQMPLIRLEDGSHVVAYDGNQPRAFLPVGERTDFPTVRRSVCRSEYALAFLRSLGLSPPDPVDDVIANVIPRYDQDSLDISDPEYRSDIERMVAAFGTDSTTQRQKLSSALGKVKFVRAVETGTGFHHFVRPAEAYQATQRLKELFLNVPGVLIVDDSRDCLRGERIRALLEASGCPLYLVPIQSEPTLTSDEKADLRRGAGTKGITFEIGVYDSTLRGLEPLLTTIDGLAQDEALAKTTLLWEALCDVEDRRGVGAFQGEYRWMRFTERKASFDASFVRLLNEFAWVPDENGVLQRPRDVVFDRTGWDANPFLLTIVRFKPPVVDELAREVGIEPGVLSILTQYGLTSVQQLTEKLRRAGVIGDKNGEEDASSVESALSGLLGTAPEPTPPIPEPQEPTTASGHSSGERPSAGLDEPSNRLAGNRATNSTGPHGGSPTKSGNGGPSLGSEHGTQSPGGRKFISYIALSPEGEEESDPDGLTREERMDLENHAIAFILEREPELKRTPTNNPGFDLTEPGADGEPVRWVEVKAMKGTLRDRPVGLSRTQFDCSQEHGKAFWLYVVERAGTPEQARVLRIQDPAGSAETFTFDHGWIAVAEAAKTTDEKIKS